MYRVLGVAILMLLLGCNTTSLEEPLHQPSSESMSTYPSTADWVHANQRQKERAQRSFGKLAIRQAPAFPGPLFVDDDEQVTIKSPQDVARRTLVLWAVELRAEGVPQEEAREVIDKLDLWAYVSPSEKQFLDSQSPPPETCQKLVWRLESIWVLLWSLGYVDKLDWPSGMCDVKQLVGVIAQYEDDPSFIANAKLRPVSELLDAQDLTMRIHWAIRHAHINNGGMVPEGLDWSGDPENIPVAMSAAVGVVEQRHYVLNWLVNFLDPKGWDDVDTPT